MTAIQPAPAEVRATAAAHQAGAETLFISDLHLAPERPETVGLFLDFLAGRAARAARLYILGDLFEAWIGDDDDTPPYPAVRAALRQLTAGGTAGALMHGNRDFLIGRAFCRDTGCTLLRDPTLIDIDGARTLLMHGDLLCTDDLDYQRFRRRVRNPLVKQLIRWKSLQRRRSIADAYRRTSAAATADKRPEIMDANAAAVVDVMGRYRATHLIHGHTHRPADHELTINGQPARRTVLAQWHPDHGEVLVHRGGTWQREVVPAISAA
ncbi:MAG TPA: UDP-2,3-diacylglucosamine diphosphatase [Lamprocystis sp. (in: g-proteobacteria)]|nr:UDP-2,3-diacylglucosamine diphosphatase [Lamprocystis sp. (in: g-proteobacteria)]